MFDFFIVIHVGVNVRYMGRFRTNRFNPWDNLNKMLGKNNTKVVEENEEQTFKSEVGN